MAVKSTALTTALTLLLLLAVSSSLDFCRASSFANNVRRSRSASRQSKRLASLRGGGLSDPYASVLQADYGRRHLDSDTALSSGLPRSCLTYEERYRPYRTAAVTGETLGYGNQYNLGSKYVVILQMHRDPTGLKEDLVLHIRALAREAQAVGFHFYILFQDPTSQDGHRLEELWSYEQVLALVPPDFRDAMIVHDAKEEYEIYYSKIAQSPRPKTGQGPGPRAPHAGISIFMHRFRRYEFAFVLEYDVRLTGHWGRYLASALQIAINAEGSESESLEGVTSDIEVNAQHVPMDAAAGLPDLIAFEAIWESDKWLRTQVGFNLTSMEEMKAMIYGGSRKLFDKMHDLASEGKDIYIESLLPLLPKLIPDGKRIVLRIPTEGESFHCNSQDGIALYDKFANTTDRCMQNYLIHPVKNAENWWKLEGSPDSRIKPS